ncbi:hypothetical protein TIFTF001_052176, partial [Ficus carica]
MINFSAGGGDWLFTIGVIAITASKLS